LWELESGKAQLTLVLFLSVENFNLSFFRFSLSVLSPKSLYSFLKKVYLFLDPLKKEKKKLRRSLVALLRAGH